MSLPGCSALFKSGVVKEALLRQHIVQPDVACPAQVGSRAICADQLGMLCCRGIVWRAGGRHVFSPATHYSGHISTKSPIGDAQGLTAAAVIVDGS